MPKKYEHEPYASRDRWLPIKALVMKYFDPLFDFAVQIGLFKGVLNFRTVINDEYRHVTDLQDFSETFPYLTRAADWHNLTRLLVLLNELTVELDKLSRVEQRFEITDETALALHSAQHFGSDDLEVAVTVTQVIEHTSLPPKLQKLVRLIQKAIESNPKVDNTVKELAYADAKVLIGLILGSIKAQSGITFELVEEPTNPTLLNEYSLTMPPLTDLAENHPLILKLIQSIKNIYMAESKAYGTELPVFVNFKLRLLPPTTSPGDPMVRKVEKGHANVLLRQACNTFNAAMNTFQNQSLRAFVSKDEQASGRDNVQTYTILVEFKSDYTDPEHVHSSERAATETQSLVLALHDLLVAMEKDHLVELVTD